MGASYKDKRWGHYSLYVKPTSLELTMLHDLAKWVCGISCGSDWLGIGVQLWATPRETCGYKLGTLNIQIQSLSHY